MDVYVTREELDKILLSIIEPIQNFNGEEFNKLLTRVETLESPARKSSSQIPN